MQWDHFMAEDGIAFAFIIYYKKGIELARGISNCSIEWFSTIRWVAEMNYK